MCLHVTLTGQIMQCLLWDTEAKAVTTGSSRTAGAQDGEIEATSSQPKTGETTAESLSLRVILSFDKYLEQVYNGAAICEDNETDLITKRLKQSGKYINLLPVSCF